MEAGDIRRKTGIVIPDALIAACALQRKAVLITKNRRDFAKVPGLKVIDPYLPAPPG